MPSERARLVNRYRERVLGLSNVVGCGWGRKRVGRRVTERECLVVFVRKKQPVTKLKRKDVVPQLLGGVVTDVVEIGDVRLLSTPENESGTGFESRRRAVRKSRIRASERDDCDEQDDDVDRRERIRPAPPGVSIGHWRITAGTFGAVVRDAETGELYILSNNHVVANQTDGSDSRVEIGDAVLQPGPYDGGDMEKDVIGHLVRFEPLRPIVGIPECAIARTVETVLNVPLRLFWPRYEARLFRRANDDNVVDAALVKPLNDRVITSCVLGIGRVRGMVEAAVGMKVLKSGRTTGVTHGEVIALGATIDVGLGGGVIARFSDQIVTTPMAEPGDSGSLVVDEEHRAVGLLFAGSESATLYNRIQSVCEKLNVTL